MSRTKPRATIIADLKQAEGALAEMAAIDRTLTEIKSTMGAAIDAAKETASRESAPLLERRKELENAVATFASLNKAALFRDRKSLDLGFGTIGYRLSTRITQVSKVTVEMTLARMKELGLLDGIRLKEEVNKDAALGWTDAQLELVGLKRRVSDDFYIDTRPEDIPSAA